MPSYPSLLEELRATRLNGASKVIYATKPESATFQNIPIKRESPPKSPIIGFRPDIVSSSSGKLKKHTVRRNVIKMTNRTLSFRFNFNQCNEFISTAKRDETGRWDYCDASTTTQAL